MVGLYLNFFSFLATHHGFPSRGFFNFGMGEKLGRFEDIHSLPFAICIFLYSGVQVIILQYKVVDKHEFLHQLIQ